MKKVLLATALTLVMAASAQAASLSFSPVTSTITVGDPVSVDINISGLESVDLAGFDLDVTYDDSVLSYTDYTLYDGLGDISSGEADDWSNGDDGSGTVNLAELSYLSDLSGQSDFFTLATITFDGLAVGNSALEFAYVDLGDGLGDPIQNVSLGTADVNVVPVPAAVWMLGSGLVGLMGIRRKAAHGLAERIDSN
jgi:hypothetical protein